ncbi:phosphopantetheine-binding protein [Ruminococcaceae bacterium OttesenSCG-928-D13]|nr:phosphopantetheine-binding protein [Ruminococcaceae bacterium OttesenSCG-928-D13]
MNRDEVYAKLTGVFRDVFSDPTIEIHDETTAADIPAWDSLEHVWLVASVEEAFGTKFDMKTVVGMKNVGEMVDILMTRQ